MDRWQQAGASVHHRDMDLKLQGGMVKGGTVQLAAKGMALAKVMERVVQATAHQTMVKTVDQAS